jgi:hypothetical protein
MIETGVSKEEREKKMQSATAGGLSVHHGRALPALAADVAACRGVGNAPAATRPPLA